jgi:hypothetical protein
MAVLGTQTIVPAGLAPAYSAASGGGDKLAPGNDTFLHVKNASGAPITVTIDSVVPSNYGTDADLVVAVPATTGDKMIGPLPASRFANPADGLVNVTYSGVTSLTVAAIKTGVS